jgi:hypothetical protein
MGMLFDKKIVAEIAALKTSSIFFSYMQILLQQWTSIYHEYQKYPVGFLGQIFHQDNDIIASNNKSSVGPCSHCIEGKIYRVAVIGYMRKSCHDAIIRRKACKELAKDTEAFLR